MLFSFSCNFTISSYKILDKSTRTRQLSWNTSCMGLATNQKARKPIRKPRKARASCGNTALRSSTDRRRRRRCCARVRHKPNRRLHSSSILPPRGRRCANPSALRISSSRRARRRWRALYSTCCRKQSQREGQSARVPSPVSRVRWNLLPQFQRESRRSEMHPRSTQGTRAGNSRCRRRCRPPPVHPPSPGC